MYEIQETIVIAAPPAAVWAVLEDYKSWPEWNTFVTSIQVQPPHSAFTEGSRQTITIVPQVNEGSGSEVYTNTISKLSPERELRWNGQIVFAAFFNTEHWCTLEEVAGEGGLGGQCTRFVQGERCTGILSPVISMVGKMDQLKQGYARMNNDLKHFVEAQRTKPEV